MCPTPASVIPRLPLTVPSRVPPQITFFSVISATSAPRLLVALLPYPHATQPACIRMTTSCIYINPSYTYAYIRPYIR